MTFTARGLYASSSKEPRRRRFRWLWVGAVVALVALLFGAVGALGAVPVGKEGRPSASRTPKAWWWRTAPVVRSRSPSPGSGCSKSTLSCGTPC
ncbi:hypothetical protein ACFQXA_20370 [Nocardiopsis composta]